MHNYLNCMYHNTTEILSLFPDSRQLVSCRYICWQLDHINFEKMDECIICKESGGGPYSVASQKSLETIQPFCEDWTKIGQNFDILNRVRDLIFSDDTKHIYHRKCYQSLCHKGNLVRAQKKYEDDIASAAESKKRGRTSIEPSSSKTRKTFDQELCIFCQSNENSAVHSVSSSDMGKNFWQSRSPLKVRKLLLDLLIFTMKKMLLLKIWNIILIAWEMKQELWAHPHLLLTAVNILSRQCVI